MQPLIDPDMLGAPTNNAASTLDPNKHKANVVGTKAAMSRIPINNLKPGA